MTFPSKAVQWHRVSQSRKCTICNKADWCGYSQAGSGCMRVESATPMRNGGWLHKANATAPLLFVKDTPPPTPTIDAQDMWLKWNGLTIKAQVKTLADKLGVTLYSLDLLRCVYSEEHGAYAFPMRAGNGAMIGLRLRTLAGDQFAVKGSKAGLFLPAIAPAEQLYVCEGQSDVAAALSMELWAIGRPSCLGCEDFVLDFVRRNKVRRVVLLSDNDDPGERGSRKLQARLPVPSAVFFPPAKDLRAAYRAGYTAEDLQQGIKDSVWTMPGETK